MDAFIVSLEKTAEKKGSVRYDSPNPKDHVTNAYVGKDAFTAGKFPKTITAIYFEGEPSAAQIAAVNAALGIELTPPE